MTNISTKRRCQLALLMCLASTPLWACIQPYSPSSTTARAAGMDTARFAQLLEDSLYWFPNKGWAATLRNANGQVVASINQGLARTACDPNGAQAFNTSTETPWGSVSKLMTTAAALRVAKQRNVSLDEPLIEHLPYRWRNQIHSRFVVGENGSGPVTLRMMLQHRGGFHHSGCANRTIKDRLLDGDIINCGSAAEPEWQPEVGVRSYANMSQGIFQIALAYMDNPLAMNFHEMQRANLPIATYDAQIQTITNDFYRNYVTQNLLTPIGVTATCNLPALANVPGANYTLWYSDANDPLGELPSDQSHSCAAGGWSMSSNEMSLFLHQLKFGSLILQPDSYALMEGSSQDSLGWWRSEWSIGTVYTHNGAWGGTRSEVRALPGGYTATLVTNSGPHGTLGGALNTALVQARRKGIADMHGVLYAR